jgi:hypothetical protein
LDMFTCVKRSAIVLAVLNCLASPSPSAFAEPQKALSQWEAANKVERELIVIATEGYRKTSYARSDAERAKLQLDITNVLAKVNDPIIALRVAHNMLAAGGKTDDRIIDEVQEEAYFASIDRVRKMNTLDAIKQLKLFKVTESLDGGYSVYVSETIAKMEQELAK